MEYEIVIRDPDNKRIRKMIKVDISEEIQYECQRNMDVILFEQSQQISQIFSLLDTKQSWGIISELASAVLGINEYEKEYEKQFLQRYLAQYQNCYDKLNYGLLNISRQLLFALEKIPNEYLDQKFIKNTVEAIISLQEKYINNKKNIILPSQKEILNGTIKKLVETYNQRLDNIILLCKRNNSCWSKLDNFGELLKNNDLLYAFANIVVYSINQKQFMQNLQSNKLNINFSEVKILEENTEFENVKDDSDEERLASRKVDVDKIIKLQHESVEQDEYDLYRNKHFKDRVKTIIERYPPNRISEWLKIAKDGGEEELDVLKDFYLKEFAFYHEHVDFNHPNAKADLWTLVAYDYYKLTSYKNAVEQGTDVVSEIRSDGMTDDGNLIEEPANDDRK